MFSHLNVLHEVKVYVQKYRQQNVLKILVKMSKISLCSRFSLVSVIIYFQVDVYCRCMNAYAAFSCCNVSSWRSI